MKVFSITDGDKVEKQHVAILFNKGSESSPDWIQLCKATENTISANAETETYDFINQDTPSTLVKRYSPSLNNPLTMFKGEDDYEYFFPKFYKLPTGSEANGSMLVVFLNESTGTGTSKKYLAWLCDTTFVFDSLDPANSQLSFTTNINTKVEGTVTIDSSGDPTFTETSST